MKTLIIGGTGLISTAIARALLERGDRVTLYSRGQTASRLDPSAALEHMVGDRKDYDAFQSQMRAAGPFDYVVDMVAFTPEDAASVVRAFRGRVRQVLFCSTGNVYRLPAARYPIAEDAPLGSNGPYGRQKAAAEAVLQEADRRGDFDVTVLRLAHAYGEGRAMLHPLGSETGFVDRLRRGKPVVVHGDGTGLWAACHVDDTARAFVGAAGNAVASGCTYNVAGEAWLTWDGYIERFAEAAGAPPPRIVHIPTDVLVRVAPAVGRRCAESYQFPKIFDTRAARRDLGFQQRISFLDGVRRTVAWLDARGLIEDGEGSATDLWYDRLIATWERLNERMASELAQPSAP